MSFDLAVWEGERPADDEAAAKAYEAFVEIMYDEVAPTEPIKAYIDELLARWPDITEDDGEDSPWSDGPLIDNASGKFFYFGMVWSMCEETAAFAAEVAAKRGLVCFDRQSMTLRN